MTAPHIHNMRRWCRYACVSAEYDYWHVKAFRDALALLEDTPIYNGLDRLNPNYSAQRCEDGDCVGRLTEPKEAQHIDEARVSFLEGVGAVGAVKYGVVTETDPQKLPMHALICMWSNVDSHSGVASQSNSSAKRRTA